MRSIAIAAVSLAFAGVAGAEPGEQIAVTGDATVALGVGAMTTRGTVGTESVTSLAATASWFIDGRKLGARLHLGLSRIGDGTNLVNTDRHSALAAAFGMSRTHLAGPLWAVGGAGFGVAVLRTHHQVVTDELATWTTHPALTWTAGIEMVHQQLMVRIDHVGAWHEVSRDMMYSLHVGMVL